MTIIIPMSVPNQAPAQRAPRTLEQRLVAAAEAACGRPHLANLRGQELYRACVTEVKAELVAQYAPTAGATLASSR